LFAVVEGMIRIFDDTITRFKDRGTASSRRLIDRTGQNG
jgi:hypothetical protein